MVYCNGLENRRGATLREFESHRFRQQTTREISMSFEGYTEVICDQGHFQRWAYSHVPQWKCRCSAPWKFRAMINTTNGIDPEYPMTLAAPKKETGFHDVPEVDHRGNHYVSMIKTYTPDLDALTGILPNQRRWTRINGEGFQPTK